MCKRFITQDVLCLITGMRLCPSNPDAVNSIMEFMVGTAIPPNQQEAIRAQCKRSLIEQYPWLGEVRIDPASWRDDVGAVTDINGKFVSIRSIY